MSDKCKIKVAIVKTSKRILEYKSLCRTRTWTPLDWKWRNESKKNGSCWCFSAVLHSNINQVSKPWNIFENFWSKHLCFTDASVFNNKYNRYWGRNQFIYENIYRYVFILLGFQKRLRFVVPAVVKVNRDIGAPLIFYLLHMCTLLTQRLDSQSWLPLL